MQAPKLPSPRQPTVGVIALVNEDWSERWQPRHQILSRLAREYHTVWLTPPHEWRQSLRRLGGGRRATSPASVPDSLLVYRPEAWLPVVYRPSWAAGLLFRARLRRARSLLRRRGCTRIVLSLWGPDHLPALDAIEHDASCYHVDDDYAFTDVRSGDDPAELAIMARVDAVFVHSREVFARMAPRCRHAALTPNGVDFDALAAPGALPADMADIPRPILGYTGYIKRQLDWSLMLELARAHPEWSFVFVGARRPHDDIAATLTALDALPNVYMLGAKTTTELARYPQHMDVCLLPYRVTDYTNAIDPLKLGECMAAGRPAVGADIAPLRAVSDLVAVAPSRQDWERCIVRALAPEARSAPAVAVRQAWARGRSWESSVRTIVDCLDERLRVHATGAPPAVGGKGFAAPDYVAPSMKPAYATTASRV